MITLPENFVSSDNIGPPPAARRLFFGWSTGRNYPV